jgi:hypothetical protein
VVASTAVFSARSLTSTLTGREYSSERPKSNCTTPLNHDTYCAARDRSRPRFWRIWARCSAVRSRPCISAKSPGAMRVRRRAADETTTTRRAAKPRRLSR